MAKGLPAYNKLIIGFSRNRSPMALFSKLIMWVERRPYSHTYIKLHEPATRDVLIFQASKGSINFFYHAEFEKHNFVVEEYEISVTSAQYLQIWTYAVRKMGSDYGWLDLIHILLAKILKIRSWFSDGDKTNICSELAARVCGIAGLPMPEVIDSVTPSELNKIVCIAPQARRIV